MPLISMTGFGRAQASASGLEVDVEIGSVNRKQFDARVALPRSLSAMESRIIPLLRERVSRGQLSVTVRVSAVQSEKTLLKVDRAAAAEVIKELRSAAESLGIPFDISARSLLEMKDVMSSEANGEPDIEHAWPAVDRAVRQAVRELVKMRKLEGASLQSGLEKRVQRLVSLRIRILKRAPSVPGRYRKMLTKRLRTTGLPFNVNDPGVQRELVLFADRSDITEELVRLESHIEQCVDLLDARKPVGRTLDFLCQEMFREINTIGSKANDGEISASVIEFKADLEVIREQIQNVE